MHSDVTPLIIKILLLYVASTEAQQTITAHYTS